MLLFLLFVTSGATSISTQQSLMRRVNVNTKGAQILEVDSWDDALHLNPSMLDGCSNVFMDVGSNRGTHVRKLFEPEKYPDSKYLPILTASFGSPEYRKKPSSETGICAFGFEANPRHVDQLKALEEAYQKQGWKVKFFAPMAVGNESGKLLNINLNDDPAHSDWAASIWKFGEGGKTVDVPQTSLADFVQAVNDHSKPGFKLMKMDIESSEYRVLPPFLRNKLLCQKVLNRLTIEWHENAINASEIPFAQHLRQQVEQPAHNPCGDDDKPTEVSTIDDESYVNDGMPLP